MPNRIRRHKTHVNKHKRKSIKRGRRRARGKSWRRKSTRKKPMSRKQMEHRKLIKKK